MVAMLPTIHRSVVPSTISRRPTSSNVAPPTSRSATRCRRRAAPPGWRKVAILWRCRSVLQVMNENARPTTRGSALPIPSRNVPPFTSRTALPSTSSSVQLHTSSSAPSHTSSNAPLFKSRNAPLCMNSSAPRLTNSNAPLHTISSVLL